MLVLLAEVFGTTAEGLGVDAEGLAGADLSSGAGVGTVAAGNVGGGAGFGFVAVFVTDGAVPAEIVTAPDLFRA